MQVFTRTRETARSMRIFFLSICLYVAWPRERSQSEAIVFISIGCSTPCIVRGYVLTYDGLIERILLL